MWHAGDCDVRKMSKDIGMGVRKGSEDYNGRSSDICRTIDVYDCSLRY